RSRAPTTSTGSPTNRGVVAGLSCENDGHGGFRGRGAGVVCRRERGRTDHFRRGRGDPPRAEALRGRRQAVGAAAAVGRRRGACFCRRTALWTRAREAGADGGRTP